MLSPVYGDMRLPAGIHNRRHPYWQHGVCTEARQAGVGPSSTSTKATTRTHAQRQRA